MNDWIRKLDDFLRLNERDILKDAGKISRKLGEQKAITEYKAFKKLQDKDYISDFDNATAKLIQAKPKKKPSKEGKP